jgi:uncharacterized protein
MFLMTNEAIHKVEKYVKNVMAADTTGHDWWHIQRVVAMAKRLSKGKRINRNVVIISALMHDISDWKFNKDENKALKKVRIVIEAAGVKKEEVEKILAIVKNISFKGGFESRDKLSIEGQIVQDADRLDALGAIGIARAFAYGSHIKRPIYDPGRKREVYKSLEEYKRRNADTITHFYDKLLLLKDRMNTREGRAIAVKRQKYIEGYLQKFYAEWIGKD